MRTTGLAVLGFVAGAVVGVVISYGLVWVWFDGLGFKGPRGSFLPQLDVLIVLAPVLGLVSGGFGTWLLVRRDRTSHPRNL